MVSVQHVRVGYAEGYQNKTKGRFVVLDSELQRAYRKYCNAQRMDMKEPMRYEMWKAEYGWTAEEDVRQSDTNNKR